MNRFAARWYDPTIARWHSPDPLEQMHSPYVALCNDPANFVDPDGRAGIHLSDWDKENIIGYASVIAGGCALAGIGQALQGASGIGQAFQSIRGVLSAVSTISSGVSLMQNISNMSKGFGIGNQMSSTWQDDLLQEVNSHSHTGLGFYGTQENLSGETDNGDPKKKQPYNKSNLHYQLEPTPADNIRLPHLRVTGNATVSEDNSPMRRYRQGEIGFAGMVDQWDRQFNDAAEPVFVGFAESLPPVSILISIRGRDLYDNQMSTGSRFFSFGLSITGFGEVGVGIKNLKAFSSVEQYSLRVAESGFYPVMKRGFSTGQELIWLNRDEVWKFGTTRNPLTRYSQSYLDNIGEYGLYYKTEFTGNLLEALYLERLKILNYRFQYGCLPSGNKIVR